LFLTAACDGQLHPEELERTESRAALRAVDAWFACCLRYVCALFASFNPSRRPAVAYALEVEYMSSALSSNRSLVIASIMASMAMVALEATIVATAMPRIVTDLGGLRLYSWVFSSFLLAQTAMTVVFGKLADVYGRKPIMLFGIAVFLVGSVLAGFAWSMPVMIVFRLIQGVGAGAIQPVSMTIVADLYPPCWARWPAV
jgi:Na+/melibiose symporter-like transporter